MPGAPSPTPGLVLVWLTAAPAIAVVAWLLVALPLLFAGAFRPAPAVACFVPVVAVLGWLGLRRAPRWMDASWWSVAALVGVSVGFAVLQVLMVSEQIIVRRDPASYVQFATWIADHGSLPIPQYREAFGAAGGTLSYESPAFYARDGSIVPQFMAGLPLLLAAGHWLGGLTGVLLTAPVLGALGVLTFGGLTARLVGSRWAPVGALALALCLPQMFVSRSTYSETAAQLVLLGGLALLVDALGVESRADRGCAALAGAALGLSVLVRVDGLRDVLPVVAYAGFLVVRRRPEALPLAGGLGIGVAYGLGEGYVLSRPYLDHLAASMRPLLAISVAVVLATTAAVFVFRRRGLPRLSDTRLPGTAAILVVAAGFAYALRPFVQTVRREDHEGTAQFIAKVQEIEGLPIEPARQYYEYSLHWVGWYAGVPAVVLGLLAAALLTRRVLRGGEQLWTLPLAVFLWTAATVLWRPAITPDHPWASRRLVPVVLPAVILLAVWAVSWLGRKAREHAYPGWVARATSLVGAMAVAVTPLSTSVALIATPIERGEAAAVRGMCRAIGPNASVVIVEPVTAQRFNQVVRGMCGAPAAYLPDPSRQALAFVKTQIEAAGRRPVFLGAEAEQVRAVPGMRVRRALRLETRQDEHSLLEPPNGTWRLVIDVWMASPPEGR